MYTQGRGDKSYIVVSEGRWILAQSFELADDLKGSSESFLSRILDKDYYFENVTWSWHNRESMVMNYHGPYLLDSIAPTDYISVDIEGFQRKFEATLHDTAFNKGISFSNEYIAEAEGLISSIVYPDSEIFWLNKKYDPSDTSNYGRYEYWAEFLIRNRKKGEVALISFSED